MKTKTWFTIAIGLVFVISGTAQTAPVKRVLMEEFTTTLCGMCPPQSYNLLTWHQQHAGNTVLYTIHEGFGVDSMSGPFTDAIEQEFANPSFGFAPAIMIDRVTFPWLSTEPYMTVGGFDTVVTRIYTNESPRVSVDIQGTYNASSRMISATVNTSFLQTVPAGDYRISLYLVEDSVIGSGSGWDQKCYDAQFANTYYPGQWNSSTTYISGYPHRHVLRSSLNGTWGSSGIIPNTPALNTPYTVSVNYQVPANYNDSKIKLVAFVAHYAANSSPSTIGNGNRWVLNTTDVELHSLFNTAITPQPAPEPVGLGLFPNPANDILTIGISANETIEGEVVLTNMLGETVKTIAGKQTFVSGLLQVQTSVRELPAGIYFVQLKTDKGTVTEKLVRN